MENAVINHRTIKAFLIVGTVLGVAATATTVLRYFEDRKHNERTRNISKMQEQLLEYQLASIKKQPIS